MLVMKAIDIYTPKKKVDFLYSDLPIEDAIKILEKRRYQMVPVVERGSFRYLYSISSGDILRKVINEKDIAKTLRDPISSCPINRLVLAAPANSELESIFDLAANQNFIPLVDEVGTFVGILTRKAFLYYFQGRLQGE